MERQPPSPRAQTHAGVTAPLVGRDTELERLRRYLAEDVPVVLLGEAGVGKTTLGRAALRATGRRWFEGGAFATLAWAPYLALERATGRRFGRADPEVVARDVARVVGDGILFVDDLQWADEGTRAVLVGLIGRVAVVLGIRLGDPATDATRATLPPTVETVHLAPLPEEDALVVARRVAPALTASALRRIVRRAGGNPLLVSELAVGGDDVPSIAAAVRIRLAALDEPSREAMGLLALAGHPLRATDLGSGSGRLVSGDLAVVEAQGRIRVRHDLLGEAVIAGLDGPTKERLHRRLGGLLADDPGEAARHFALAGDDARAHELALAAAASAATPGERASHLVVAADTARGPDRWALRVSAANLLVDALDPERAAALLAERIDDTEPSIALVAARIHGTLYDLDRSRAAIARGLASLVPGDPATIETEIRLRVQAVRVAVRAKDDAGRTLAAARAVVALADHHGFARSAARAALGSARYLAGDLAGTEDSSAAMELAFAEGDEAGGIGIGSTLVFNLLKAARAREARQLAERLRVRAAAARLGAVERHMTGWVMGCAWHAGELDIVTALGATIDPGDEDTLIDWYRTQVLADLGRVDEARVRAERELPLARAGEYDLGEVLWLLADVAFMAGRWHEAIAHADRHAAEVNGAQHRAFVELPRAWALVELGRRPDWPSIADALPMLAGGTIELEAVRTFAEGRYGAAAEAFDVAADRWSGAHARGEWRSRWAAAESRRRSGDVAGARSELLVLEERLEHVHHAPFLARVRRSLRAVGERRSARATPVAGTDLTARELEILGMSGGGATDAEIAARLGISRWAVVRAAESGASKLGAATRLEALAAMPRLVDSIDGGSVRSRSSGR